MAMGSMGSSDMSSGGYGMISAGVDDMMQTNEFIINTATNWVKTAKDRKDQRSRDKIAGNFTKAQTELLKIQIKSEEEKQTRQKNIRNLMLGYR